MIRIPIMYYNLDNIKTSTEFHLLVLISACFLYNVHLLCRPDPPFVHHFRDFDELMESLTDCLTDLEREQSRCSLNNGTLRLFNDEQQKAHTDYHHIKLGGHFEPTDCVSQQRVAIVVPYRDREDQLEEFTRYIHRFLPSQLIDYSVYVIEQTESKPFNRAKLFNVGVREILRIQNDTCCFIFHDVDMLPLDQRNLYMCSHRPRHMSPSVNTLRFNLLYPELFGGVIAVSRDQFEAIGGFSNLFYGWGGEDDDMFERFRAAGFGIDRTPTDIGLYTMLEHPKMPPNPDRHQFIGTPMKEELEKNSGHYSLQKLESLPLYTRILVSL